MTMTWHVQAAGIGAMEAAGVFVGISYNEYAQLSAALAPAVSTYTATGGSLSVAAGRISYMHGLRGPCVAIDTACSSGLVAIALVGVLHSGHAFAGMILDCSRVHASTLSGQLL